MLADYFALAFKNIRRRRLRSWLTIIGIFIGIAAVVSLISLGQGLKDAITGTFSEVGGDKLIIQNANTGFGAPGSTAIKKLNEHDIKVIKKVPGVEVIVPRLLRMGAFRFNGKTKYNFIASFPNNREQINTILESLSLGVQEGRMLEQNDKNKVVLGSYFATSKPFGRPIKAGDKLLINGKKFEVVGILAETGNMQMDQAALMMEDDMKSLLGIKDEYDLITVKVSSAFDAREVSDKIKEAMRKDRGLKKGEEDFSVQTPSEVIESFNVILNSVTAVLIGIALISLLVGGIGIMNTMYTSVLERTKEIGIMKAIGAKNRDVFMIFLFDSGILGMAGGAIGIGIGILLSKTAELMGKKFFDTNLLHANLSLYLILGALFFSFIVGAISGVFPALQASKLKPVEALRKT